MPHSPQQHPHQSHHGPALIESPVTAAEIRYNISLLEIQVASIDSKVAVKLAGAGGGDPAQADWIYRSHDAKRWKQAEIARLTLIESRVSAPEIHRLAAIVATCRKDYTDDEWAAVEAEARAQALGPVQG